MPYPYDTYTFPRITSTAQLNGSDLFPLWVQQNGGTCGLSLTLLAAWLTENQAATSSSLVTTYAAPSATGFTVTLPDNSYSKWLVLTPVAGYAAGTIVLPALANCEDQQTINVNCTQSVTTLTISGNGSTVTGAPTTLAANAYFTLRFDAVMSTWYRIS